MPLMERVTMLLRANVNDMIDRAENPEKMLKQLVRDLENQLLQLKTQLAIGIADKHVFMTRVKAEAESEKKWRDKAQLAVSAGKDEMARAALARAVSHEQMRVDLAAQLDEQNEEVENIRTMYNQLDGKLKQAQHHMVMLAAQLRRAQMSGKAISAREAADRVTMTLKAGPSMERMKARIEGAQAENYAKRQLIQGESLEESFDAMERDEKVERLLEDLKAKQGMLEAG